VLVETFRVSGGKNLFLKCILFLFRRALVTNKRTNSEIRSQTKNIKKLSLEEFLQGDL
jgi:hypothetical protein